MKTFGLLLLRNSPCIITCYLGGGKLIYPGKCNSVNKNESRNEQNGGKEKKNYGTYRPKEEKAKNKGVRERERKKDERSVGPGRGRGGAVRC